VAGTIWLGVYPKPFLDRMEPSVDNVIRMVQTTGVSSPASYQADAAAGEETR
jgi:NADH:ubiquinone oxidoreductase subunit 4 (subunit M)